MLQREGSDEGETLTQLARIRQGGFARVYLSTEPDGITTKALKVIAKEQLKSTKNKSKVRVPFSHSFNENASRAEADPTL